MLAFLTALAALVVVSPSAPTLKFTAPAGWTSQTPGTSSRVAQFALPKAAGDQDDATLVVYYFGAGGGGGVQANMDRWIGQMTQPDGRASKDVAQTSTLTVNGLKVSAVDVSGTYVAEMSPGATDHFNASGWRLIAAVVETTGGPYYLKLTGPAKTVARWQSAFDTFVHSLKYE